MKINKNICSNKQIKEEQFFDNLAEKQEGSWWGHRTYAGQQRQKKRAQLVANFLSPINETTKVLEIGCGAGDFTIYLLEKLPFCTYYGMDISKGLLEIAQRRIHKKGVTFLKGNVEDIDPQVGSFDAVIGASILHHLDTTKTLSGIYKVLNPGGKIFFMEPNMRNPQIWLERNVKFIRKVMQNTEDETAFYKSEMMDMLKKGGFIDITVEPFDFMHPIVPKVLVTFFSSIFNLLEEIPILKEFGGSLMIKGKKPI